MATGYAKIEGKPLLTLAHGTVGLQHASMALYNAWCDRVPVYMMVGNTVDATKRAPGGEWVHSVQDPVRVITGELSPPRTGGYVRSCSVYYQKIVRCGKNSHRVAPDCVEQLGQLLRRPSDRPSSRDGQQARG
jgi:hypothetical protein